jgi:hypothetical protein
VLDFKYTSPAVRETANPVYSLIDKRMILVDDRCDQMKNFPFSNEAKKTFPVFSKKSKSYLSLIPQQTQFLE